ncbi:MAG: NAD(P)-binding protein, partial [Actinomycetales bacterium]
MTTSSTDTQVVIVGAGQAGLAVAFYLRRFELTPGTDFVLYDRGPGWGGAWQHRWDALKLGSAHHVNDLPGMAELGISFDTADRSLPAKDIVAGYYRRYEEHFDLRVRRPVTVTSVFDRGADLMVQHTDGETATRIVV